MARGWGGRARPPHRSWTFPSFRVRMSFALAALVLGLFVPGAPSEDIAECTYKDPQVCGRSAQRPCARANVIFKHRTDAGADEGIISPAHRKGDHNVALVVSASHIEGVYRGWLLRASCGAVLVHHPR